MKKRILSVLFIVALLVAALMVTAQAENPTTCPCGCGTALDAVAWTSWDGKTDITDSGHYKLTAKSTATSETLTGINVVLDLNGYQLINMNDAQRTFKLMSGAKLYVMSVANTGGKGGEIVSSCQYGGGAVYLDGNSQLHLYSGTLRQYTDTTSAASVTSGLIHAKSGDVYIHGGTVTGQSYSSVAVTYGGAIFMESGNLTMTAGTINGGNANSGAAVYLKAGTATLTGGTIHGGTIGATGGGNSLYIANTCATTLGGTLNVPDDYKMNIFLGGSADVTIEGTPYLNGFYAPRSDNTHPKLNTTNAKIFVSEPLRADALTFAGTADAAACVASGSIQAADPALTLSYNEGLVFTQYDCPCCETDPAQITWTAWNGAPTEGGHYYLGDDSSYTAVKTLPAAAVTLNLNGHTLTGSTARFLALVSGTELNIVDSGANGTISTSYGSGNGALFNVTAGTLKLYDGTFRQTNANYGASTGEGAIAQCATDGTIYVLGDAVLDASAVTSTNATRSPLVCKKTAYIQGGTILANAAGNSVYVTTAATSLSVSGGDIRGDLAVAKSGTVTLSGAPTVSEVRFASAGLTVNIENLTTGASIGVNASGAFTAAANNDAAAWVEAGYLTSNVSGKSVVAREGILYIEEVATPVRCPHCGEDVQWTLWEKQTESGHYYLTAGYSSSQYVTAADTDVVLDLRGNWYTSADARSFVVKDGATFSLVNTANTLSAVSGGHSSGPVEVQADSTFNLYPGITCKQTAGSENTMAITAKGGTVVFAEDVDMSVLNGKIKNIGGYLEGIEGALLMDKANTNGGIWYQTAQEAADLFVDEDHDFIRLMGDAAVTATQPGTFFNINGHDLTVNPASTVAVKVANMKSTVAAADPATVTADEADIQLVTPYTDKVQFVALSNGAGAYTVHRLELQLSYVTFRPAAFGFYYKANFNTDDVLANEIDAYGVALSLTGVPDASIPTKTEMNDFANARGTDVKFGGLFGIMKSGNTPEQNVTNGMQKVYANCYVKIGDMVILSDNRNVGKNANDAGFSGVGMSLFDVMQRLNGMTLEGEQLTAVETFKTDLANMGVQWPALGDTELSIVPLA